ncbi:hypothetical protein Afil01_45750 [Actinorhabdospora filicis]|uniref:Uncharacterized protein n=1 Tax=Actinorhabdospora filicis TaxID=1785913 RepID=A0A9W6SPJ4_9ACTN|nr:hypothetical protein Afil01_45750 [Actinorhabdospora filicis]
MVLDGNGGETGRAPLERPVLGGRQVVFGGASGTQVESSAADLFERGTVARSGWWGRWCWCRNFDPT